MNIESEVFNKSKFNYDKLIKYGFKKKNNIYLYNKNILNDSFNVEVSINKETVKVKVIDLNINEEYIGYRISDLNGEFVDKIRNIIKELLEDIRDNCCLNNLFIFDQTNRIIDFVYNKYNDKPLFMFDDSPDCGVFKNMNINKWYGIIMTIDKSKLDKNESGKIEVLNVKIDTEKIKDLIKINGIYEAYHMNKKYWISIILNDTVNDELIEELICESYNNILK